MKASSAVTWIWTDQSNETGNHHYGEFESSRVVDVDPISGRFIENALDSHFSKYSAGKFVIPGLNDSHIHVSGLGESASLCNLKGCKSISEMKLRLTQYATASNDRNIVIGVNWDQKLLGRYPNRFDIDEVISDIPVFLYRMCFHIGVANTNLLHKIGVLNSGLEQAPLTIDGGCIDVDEDQNVTGVLKENATRLVSKYVETLPTHSLSSQKRMIELGLQICLENGLTSVQSNDRDSINIYRELQDENKLVIRVFHTPYAEEVCNNNDNYLLLPDTHLRDNKRLIRDRVKVFSDGSLGAETALVRRPYKTKKINGDDNYGIAIHSDEDLMRIMIQSYDLGYRLEVHSIGDGSAYQVLKCLSDCPYKARPCLTHCQILGEDLVDKMLELGVVANIQPSFVPTDSDFLSDRFQQEDIESMSYLYSWKSMMNRGVVCSGSSDSPIETCDAFQGMFDAMFRLPRTVQARFIDAVESELSASLDASWNVIVDAVGLIWHRFLSDLDQATILRPSECLAFSESLWLYTQGSAFSCMSECHLGRVETGYLADCLILNYDPSLHPFLMNRDLRESLSNKFVNFRNVKLIDSVWVGGQMMHSSHSAVGNHDVPDLCGGGTMVSGKNGIGGILLNKCACCNVIN